MSSRQHHDGVILVGLGANLESSHGGPRATLAAAVTALDQSDLSVAAVSPWYESAPVPLNDQPWFVNGVALIETELDPEALLARLHGLEHAFGRVRRERWEARVLDIDLLDYRGLVRSHPAPILPHPAMAVRAFVLLPLRDLVPGWRHPISGRSVDELIAALPAGQEIRRIVAAGDP
jgi:2-amino-4-hydroxy-6-hydroxymethyldihydropteridine diphosphokinase